MKNIPFTDIVAGLLIVTIIAILILTDTSAVALVDIMEGM